jgi:Spy/CpxP family protein refolding chaperone
MEGVLALLEADRIDPAQVEAFRRQTEEEHRRIGDVIAQALTEVHDVLTPQQRHALADYVRAHRWGRMH